MLGILSDPQVVDSELSHFISKNFCKKRTEIKHSETEE